jgi:hypothetical protein
MLANKLTALKIRVTNISDVEIKSDFYSLIFIKLNLSLHYHYARNNKKTY